MACRLFATFLLSLLLIAPVAPVPCHLPQEKFLHEQPIPTPQHPAQTCNYPASPNWTQRLTIYASKALGPQRTARTLQALKISIVICQPQAHHPPPDPPRDLTAATAELKLKRETNTNTNNNNNTNTVNVGPTPEQEQKKDDGGGLTKEAKIGVGIGVPTAVFALIALFIACYKD